VRCFPDVAAENKFLAALPPFPVGARQVAAWEKTWARFDGACARNGGSLLQHDTSTDVARDMNLLRQAMDIGKLNYVGLSDATGLGAIYANLFPATVGHMVLDGNVDPVAWARGGSLPDALREGEDLATASVARSFLDLCGKASTAACAFSAGTPAATRAKFSTLLNRLLKHPVFIGTPPQTFTYADAINAMPPIDVSNWPSTAVLLQQVWAASAAGHVPTAASGAAAPDAVYTGPDQKFAEFCADTADPHRTRAYQAAAGLAEARSGGFGLELTWTEEPCAQWPAGASQDRYTGPWNRETEFFNPDTCATNYEVSYLETGALPPAGTVCQPDAPPFPAP
jgi:hypothetical protein